jgi:hypothetical protein
MSAGSTAAHIGGGALAELAQDRLLLVEGRL